MRIARALAITVALLLPLTFGACARQGQNAYRYDEVGRTQAVTFGTVVSLRQIDIIGRNTGGGALLGGAVGAGAGSYAGSGSGNAWAILGGAVLGAAAGAIAEQAASDRKGLEYTVVLETGVTLTVAQDQNEGDAPIRVGERVIVQNSGGYQRVLPATQLPTEIKRPQGIKVTD